MRNIKWRNLDPRRERAMVRARHGMHGYLPAAAPLLAIEVVNELALRHAGWREALSEVGIHSYSLLSARRRSRPGQNASGPASRPPTRLARDIDGQDPVKHATACPRRLIHRVLLVPTRSQPGAGHSCRIASLARTQHNSNHDQLPRRRHRRATKGRATKGRATKSRSTATIAGWGAAVGGAQPRRQPGDVIGSRAGQTAVGCCGLLWAAVAQAAVGPASGKDTGSRTLPAAADPAGFAHFNSSPFNRFNQLVSPHPSPRLAAPSPLSSPFTDARRRRPARPIAVPSAPGTGSDTRSPCNRSVSEPVVPFRPDVHVHVTCTCFESYASSTPAPCAATPSPRARLLAVAQTSSRQSVIALTGASLLRSGHHLQSRGFWFGPWPCHADPSQHREARRRHRVLRYRHMESLHRKLSRENGPRDDSAMGRFPQSRHSPAGSKCVDVGGSDDLSGLRPGRNIQDAEREVVDHLFGTRIASSKPSNPRTPRKNIRKYLETRQSHTKVTPESVSHATATAGEQDGGFIDPVTNRRVTSSSDGAMASATRKSEDVAEDTSKTSEDGKGPNQYEDLPKYSSTTLDNPNAPRKLTAEEKSKEYKDLGEYKPVQWNEPDGLREPTPEEKSKEYKDLGEYKPVQWNEPDGLRKPTPEEESKVYNDLDKYEPVSWNEPDGLLKPTPEE
ncbi:Uncharacterized protein TCAP_06936, partial [Tolypocladium capitatum]